MRSWAVTGAAAVLVASLTPAFAVDNDPVTDGDSGSCTCVCMTPNSNELMFYPSQGSSCSALNNRTCNAEHSETHIIETGTTAGCSAASPAGPRAGGNLGVSNPGSPQGGLPSLQLPLTGGLRQ